MNFNGESEKMFKDALDQLLLKDEIISDLQKQLSGEREENSDLRKKLNELESKLSLYDDQIENIENIEPIESYDYSKQKYKNSFNNIKQDIQSVSATDFNKEKTCNVCNRSLSESK